MKKYPLIEFHNNDGIKYRIFFRKITEKDLKGARAKAANGICYSPDSKNPKIIIDPNLKETKLLSVLLEECLHSFFWDKNEKEVRLFCRVVTEIIYLLGWKNENYKKKKKNDKK